MANVSRALRQKRKLRRHANQMLRAAKGSRKDALKYFSLLMTVLAQKGGEIVVTKGTIEQVEKTLPRLSFEITKGGDAGEFTIRLVEAPLPVIEGMDLATDESVTVADNTAMVSPGADA